LARHHGRVAESDPFPPEALLDSVPGPLRALAEGLRTIVREAEPLALERVRPGWGLIGYDLPVGRRTSFFAWVWPEVSAGHVHLGFPQGAVMDDPRGLLDGAGVTKRARWVTLKPGAGGTLATRERARFVELVHEAARVARMSRGERYARAQQLEGGSDRSGP